MYKEFLKSGGRFTTTKGEVTVEQLLALPATQSNINFLDSLVVDLDANYSASKGKSFVVKKTKKDKSIKLAFDIAYDILKDMIEAFEASKNAVADKAYNQKIMAKIVANEDKELDNMSSEELRKLLKK
ncbi:MAG: hypothetical protein GY775_16880 [Candidatus Scalindua sp.]|nr:hypothetical protein [Candidatus Scalindua sp.]